MRTFLLTCVFIFISSGASALPLLARQLGNSSQLIWVEPAATFQSKVHLYEKIAEDWKEVSFNRPAVIGKAGFADPGKKVEGDKKSPQGLYPLGMLFAKDEFTGKSTAQRLTKDDKWIDDPAHPDYNKWVRGETTAKSYENLLLSSGVYDYIQVINYNMNPIVPGKGSAIFLHVWASKLMGTMGCVALEKKDVEFILRWLDPRKKPQILLGNQK